METQPPETDPLLKKLDEINLHLKRMDQRDRLRMTGGIIRSIIGIVPLLISLWFAWYLYAHFDDLMRTLVREAAEQSMEATKSGSNSLLEEMKKYLQ